MNSQVISSGHRYMAPQADSLCSEMQHAVAVVVAAGELRQHVQLLCTPTRKCPWAKALTGEAGGPCRLLARTGASDLWGSTHTGQ